MEINPQRTAAITYATYSNITGSPYFVHTTYICVKVYNYQSTQQFVDYANYSDLFRPNRVIIRLS